MNSGCQNIYKNSKKFIINPKQIIIDKDFLSKIYKISFIFIIGDNPKAIDDLTNKYKNIDNKYAYFMSY